MNRKKSLLLGLCVLVLFGFLMFPVSAALIKDCCTIPSTPTDWTLPCSVDKFDASLGTLNSVTLDIKSCGNIIGDVDSRDSSPQFFTVKADGSSLTTLPDTQKVSLAITPIDDTQQLPANIVSEGQDCVFSGADSFHVDETSCGTSQVKYTLPAGMANYIGAGGEASFSTKAIATSDVKGSGNICSGVQTLMDTKICVAYDYTPPGCLEVCKDVDDNGNAYAPGKEFTICVGDDCRVFQDGDCSDFTNLVPGGYLISETDPGVEWTVGGADGKTATVVGGDVCAEHKYTVDNTLDLGCLEVCKDVDDNGNAYAPGKEFTICVGDDCRVFKDGDCEDYTGLVPGGYLIKENDPGVEWTVGGADGKTATVAANDVCVDHKYTVTNTLDLGCLQICKAVDWNGMADPLTDPQFQVCLDGTTNCQTIGDTECARFENLVPGEYTFSETPPGVEWVTTYPSGKTTTVAAGDLCRDNRLIVKNTHVSGCTYTPGYWKTHSINGPAPYDNTWAKIPETKSFYQSGATWYGVINNGGNKGNAYYQLSFQYIAAVLNTRQATPASTPQVVKDAMADADKLFKTYTPAQIGALKGNDPTRARFINDAGILSNFNAGTGIGPGHCGNEIITT